MSDKIAEFNGQIDALLASQAINSTNDGITISNMLMPDQPLIFVNKAFEEMTGYSKADVIGRNCRFLQRDIGEQPELAIIRDTLKHQKNCRVILKNFTQDGTLFWNELSMAPIINNKGIAEYYVGIQKDITTEISQKNKILYLAEHDDLTGLLNYRSYFSKISSLIEHAIQKNLKIAVGIADINFFKHINDTYGHLKGNTILKIIGSELIQEFSSDDILARFGGDEFCFALVVEGDDPEFFYKKIQKVVRATNFALSNVLQISMSAGMVIEQASESMHIDQLIHLADTVMYKNKKMAHLDVVKNQK